ncbi:PQQ-dependent dehydrogenase, methanol/ethanol family [Methylobacterium sp. C25]|uniref:PQQ-dependent methanol/ethanol family dehydrogenase n=1 Tax=Methylobacterium sp. C25 TaxID=2721622 RepID=UPI002D7E260E|nr:PQQ-dependent methanol/ethanol family dehydrogenase [Methylobacterium sp. C25]MCE4223719.1 PQQ-dependent dehydrogenase, methanol/ethanol family [Methylobacterium sp. C25]
MRLRDQFLTAAGALALLVGAAAMSAPQAKEPEKAAASGGVSDQDILNDAKTPEDVVSYGLGPQAQRYSPLKAINKETIKGLVPAYSFSFGGEKQRGQESQALVKDGVIYVTGSYSRMYAIDSRTGEKLWQYEARLPEGILPCCDVVNRGAALYKNLVIFGTLDAKLVALDQKTGKVVWKKDIDDFKSGYSYTAAPLIVKGKVITGVSGGEFGVVGRVEARDAETGELIWQRPVIEGHMGTLNGKESTMTGKVNETWPGDMWKYGGGATWLGGTYDPETNLIYMGTGNPGPWNSWLRPGDNKWTASRIALNPENGEIVWGFQTTPHDGWDFDGVNEFVPFDLNKGGKTIKAGATADRNGFFYVLDRTNGKFISASPFVEKINWASGIDENGRPKYIAENRPGDPSKATGDEKKGKSVFAVPSFLGGKNWMPIGYSPDTKLFYVPSNEWGMDIWNEAVSYKKGAAYLGAGFTIKPVFEDHIGSLKAIDPATGKVVWNYKNKAPLWGGVLTTGGGLVFTGTPEGFLKAFDAKTGEEVWKFNTGTGVVSSPITWEQDGEQWIGVAAGWGGAVPLWGGEVAKSTAGINQGGSFWAFKLPKKLATR